MYCRLCENLERALAASQNEYFEASTLAYHMVSKKFAADKNVEMERAKAELQEHRAVCLAAITVSQAIPVGMLRRSKPDVPRSGRVMDAA